MRKKPAVCGIDHYSLAVERGILHHHINASPVLSEERQVDLFQGSHSRHIPRHNLAWEWSPMHWKQKNYKRNTQTCRGKRKDV